MQFMRNCGTLQTRLSSSEKLENERRRERMRLQPTANGRRITLPYHEFCERSTTTRKNDWRESVSGQSEESKREKRLLATVATPYFLQLT
jgi:hypothetical protein